MTNPKLKVQQGGAGAGELLIVEDNDKFVPHFQPEAWAAVLMYGGARQHEARAARIVKACNAHDALVAALEAARDYIEAMPYEKSNHPSTILQDKISDALKSVKGE